MLMQWEKAIPFYRKALELKNDDDKIYNSLGICYAIEERYDEAENFLKAVAINPDSIYYINLGDWTPEIRHIIVTNYDILHGS
jgi:Flp pilus assembly protein TadD